MALQSESDTHDHSYTEREGGGVYFRKKKLSENYLEIVRWFIIYNSFGYICKALVSDRGVL